MATAVATAGAKGVKRDIPFSWSGMDKKGNRVSGKSLAPDEAALRADLRRQGIGAELLRHLANLAHRQGFPQLYCATATAQSLLQRLGWTRLPDTVHHGVALTVFVVGLDDRDASPVSAA